MIDTNSETPYINAEYKKHYKSFILYYSIEYLHNFIVYVLVKFIIVHINLENK